MDIIKNMDSLLPSRRTILAGGPLPIGVSLLSKLSDVSRAYRPSCAQRPGDTNAGDWLFAEEEYFPFAAESFEER